MASCRQQCRGFLAPAVGLFALLALLAWPAAGDDSPRNLAAERYRYARLLLQDLTSVPAEELGEEQYLLVIDAFQKVHRTSPASPYCDDALLEAAHLYREMSGRFGAKPYKEKTIAGYQLVISEYPQSKLAETARQALVEIEKGIKPGRRPALPALEDESEVQKTSSGAEPGHLDPASPASPPDPAAGAVATTKDAAQGANGQQGAAPVAIPATGSLALPVAGTVASAPQRNRLVQIEGVRFWSHPDYTRVVLELDDRVEVSYDQLQTPKRLFFDLQETRLGQRLTQESTFEVGDSFLKRIRVAQFRRRSTRVVFDLARSVYFHVTWLANPSRLVVEVRDEDQPAVLTQATPAAPPASAPAAPTPPQAPKPHESAAQPPRVTTGELAGKTEAPAAVKGREPAESFARALEQRSDSAKTPNTGAPTSRSKPAQPDAKTSKEPKETQAPPQEEKTVAAVAEQQEPPPAEPAKTELAKVTPPPDLEPELPSPKPASANARGQRNLIRALGLKINRVVIDAGHGGHDVGSSGPSGLREKDLVLDIALRLGKLIEEGLGGEVIQTRADDRFLSLKERTTLANQRQADLFISIHANSSRTRNVRGIETYYLNFTTDSWALTVASRENAASDRPVHELQDLVSKIALKEKIEESREFATRVQSALFDGLSDDTKGLRDRGVRKAPFMVLIGAKMPAILAEIGFISNPQTEKLLKTGGYRQQVANHLYQGILGYAESLGNVTMARGEKGEPTVE
jgi:N-acetylmuramoyl-L-alanine amidase